MTERERSLEIDWRPEGERPSLVRVDITPLEGGTRLVLEHMRLDERRCMRYGTAWTHAVEQLQRVVAA